MKIGSYNIRGLGGRAKKKEVQQIVKNQKLDLLCLQETKMENVSRCDGGALWDGDYFDWVWQQSQGAAGSLFIMWRTTIFTLQQSFQGDGFIGVRGLWGINRIEITLVNVYAPCDSGRKAQLWHNIRDLMRNMGVSYGAWLVILMRSYHQGKQKELQGL